MAISDRIGTLGLVVAGLTLASLPSAVLAGMSSASPLPMPKGTDITIGGTGLANTTGVTVNGLAATIVGPPTDTAVVIRLPVGIFLPARGTWAVAQVCRESASGTECKQGALAGDILRQPPPPILGSVLTPGHPQDVRVCGDVAYVADTNAGLTILDVSNPVAPTILSTLDTQGCARALENNGTLVYIADCNGGLVVVDAGDPRAPVVLATLPIELGAIDIEVEGCFAYLTGRYLGGLTVVDVHNPSVPTVVGSLDHGAFTEDFLLGLEVKDGMAYVGAGFGLGPIGEFVVDVSNPAHPTFVGESGYPAGADIEVTGASTFATLFGDEYNSLCVDLGCIPYPGAPLLGIVSGATPGFPIRRELTTSWTGNGSHGLEVGGGFAFVVDETGHLTVVDVADPANPAFVTLLQLPGYPGDLALVQDRAYIPTYAGLVIVDIGSVTSVEVPPCADSCVPGDCPNSILDPTVLVPPRAPAGAPFPGTVLPCDSGVPNLPLADGCTISDQVQACLDNATAGRGFEKCVKALTKQLRRQRVITEPQRKAIDRCAKHFKFRRIDHVGGHGDSGGAADL